MSIFSGTLTPRDSRYFSNFFPGVFWIGLSSSSSSVEDMFCQNLLGVEISGFWDVLEPELLFEVLGVWVLAGAVVLGSVTLFAFRYRIYDLQ